jgi:hypothetical protein
MPGKMPVEPLSKAQRDHLTDEQGDIVDTLREPHQIALPKDRLGLLSQLHSHGALLYQH